MIRTEELMIGDWVMSIHPAVPRPIKVTEIGKNDIGYKNGILHISFIEPTPITPKILEKNGFTKSTPPPGIHAKCYNLDNKEEKYCLTIANYNKYKRLMLDVDSEDSECFNIKCNYVHELQHALRLCGIKKEIEI